MTIKILQDTYYNLLNSFTSLATVDKTREQPCKIEQKYLKEIVVGPRQAVWCSSLPYCRETRLFGARRDPVTRFHRERNKHVTHYITARTILTAPGKHVLSILFMI